MKRVLQHWLLDNSVKLGVSYRFRRVMSPKHELGFEKALMRLVFSRQQRLSTEDKQLHDALTEIDQQTGMYF